MTENSISDVKNRMREITRKTKRETIEQNGLTMGIKHVNN